MFSHRKLSTKLSLAAVILTLSGTATSAATVSATFSGTLQAEPVNSFYATYFGTPDFLFDGASYEITIHGDSTTAANYTTSWRGSSQKYDFTRFDVTVDLSISNGTNTIDVTGQSGMISFYNFLNESPWGDIVSFNTSIASASGGNYNVGLGVVDQQASSVIWNTDGFITSLSALEDPNFDPNGILRGTLQDYSDSYASYKTGALTQGPAAVQVSAVPLPAGLAMILTGLGAIGIGLRRRTA